MKSSIPALSLLAALCACGPSGAPSGAELAPVRPAAPPPAPPKPPPDPMRDVAAWQALPESERASRARGVVSTTDAGNPMEVEKTRAFLDERGAQEALSALAKAAVANGSIAPWAHERMGRKNIGREVDACLAECRSADECGNDAFTALKQMRDQHGGTWWVDAEGEKDVRARCEALRKQEVFLRTPYGEGVDNWVRRQRAVEVMKDAPAIHGITGPYLVFVSLDSDVSKPSKEAKKDEEDDPRKPAPRRSLSEVKPEELAKAQKILDRNVALMADFYEGWMKEMGPVLGLERYGPENTDMKTLFKMNVFMNKSEYHRYNAKDAKARHAERANDETARAFYSPQEPRFITTYDGGESESNFDTDQTQCHEATHQAWHFYTWDLSRKELGREPKWEEAGGAGPLWLHEGFAEFFSSFAVKGGKRVWMEPLEDRIFELWLLPEICKAKKWKLFEMKEFLRMRRSGDLSAAARSRATAGSKDVPVAESILGNYFYGKAWSFVSFLWNAEEAGKPKWRARFIEYMKREMHLKYETNQSTSVPEPRYASMNDFRKIMGVERAEKDARDPKDATMEAFEKEWLAYEAKLVASRKQPNWDARRDAALKHFGTAK
jgi:hypothetical protein